jgi:CBS domain-containing protein
MRAHRNRCVASIDPDGHSEWKEPMMTRVMDVMTTDVFAVSPDTSLETAARLLAQKRISGAPVIDEKGRVVGVVSASDLVDPDADVDGIPGFPLYYRVTDGLAQEIGDHVHVRAGRVTEVMTHAVMSIAADATVAEAASRMLQLGVHRLLVVRGDDELAGVVSTVDLLRGFVRMHASRAAA